MSVENNNTTECPDRTAANDDRAMESVMQSAMQSAKESASASPTRRVTEQATAAATASISTGPTARERDSPRCIWEAAAALGEGPLWSIAQQALYWVDILNRRLHRWSASHGRETWTFEEEISAVAERANGNGLLVSLRHGFAFFDPVTHDLARIAHPERHLPGNRFNDGKCDAAGRFWAGTMDFACRETTGSLYRLDRSLACERMDSGYVVTNGPAWSLDQKSLYHNDSLQGRVYVFDFEPATGALANKRLFLQFAPDDGVPDGMTTDAEGGLWISHWGAGKVTRHAPDGSLLDTIRLPCSQVTSCTFGGPDLSTLFITTATCGLDPAQRAREPLAGSLFAVETDVAGLPAHRFAG